jgi:hypothetical protein
MAGKEQFDRLVETLGKLEDSLPDLWNPQPWIDLSKAAELACGDASALKGAASGTDADDIYDMLEDLADKAKAYKDKAVAFCSDDDQFGGASMASFRQAVTMIKGYVNGKAGSFG